MMGKEIRVGLSYNDVLLVPKKSRSVSRREIDTTTTIAKGVVLNIPFIPANMDTVSEHAMAIAIAREGGIGIIHRFMDIEREASQVRKVKRAEGYVIENPYSIGPDYTIEEAKEQMARNEISGFLVVDKQNKLLGVLSHRDIMFTLHDKKRVKEEMTPRSRLIVGYPGMERNGALDLLKKHKIEKLPLVDKDNVVKGLITSKDLHSHVSNKMSAKDKKGRLLVGGATGVKGDYIERAVALQDAEADIVVLDVAHGHSDSVIEAVRKLKKELDIPLIVGNVATKEAVNDLASAGADCIKVGIGPGAACTTRLVTGAGMPQLTAIMDCYEASSKQKIPLIADGGIKDSGDITKALAAGAGAVMFGSLFAGTDESPGYFVRRNGVKYKAYRGMASLGANVSRRKLDNMDIDPDELAQIVPEGVESSVPYRGSVKEVVSQLIGGLRSGMSYCGATNLEELRKNAEFIMLTQSGAAESYNKLQPS
ncbi:MAG: IMP dehydrogenase [Candidatus Micrarchaeota archaeon]|nr:IMP dehydrogenase [Candidatus Micrarchaeota archaeon]MDE1849438.1 IMP dehydrogenase [Candidatus Micrarchaeota archaeon]